MSCYHPITMYRRVGTKETTFKSKRIPTRDKSEKYRIKPGWEELQVPCGQCIGCRLTYSRQWAQRIQKESLSWEQNWFLTLTYDTMWVPRKDVINEETGELITGMPLVPEHLTAFMKKLRRRWEYQYGHKGIRFYACGEYGEEHERPHYHICLMNFPIKPESLELKFHNWLGDPIYKSEEIEKLWGYGITGIGALTWQSAAYVARYMVKKQKGPESDKFVLLGASVRRRPFFTHFSVLKCVKNGRLLTEAPKSTNLSINDNFVSVSTVTSRRVTVLTDTDRLYVIKL